MKTKAVLQELFELLEAYAPSWYSEEQRNRTLAALKHPAKPALHLIKTPAEIETDRSSEPTTIGTRSFLQ